MAKKLNQSDYQRQLTEQIFFLQQSAKSYDCGAEFEAKRIALTIRVLIYDKDKTSVESLLSQMGLKNSIDFYSGAKPYQNNNLLLQQCLCGVSLGPNGQFFIPLRDSLGLRKLKCGNWLSEITMDDNKGRKYTRLELIKLLANKDGGAHVDSQIGDNLSNLKDPFVSGWQVIKPNGQEQPLDNDVVYCSMRQMAFEILKTIYDIKPECFSELYF